MASTSRPSTALTAATYLMLTAFAVAQGALGTFFYSVGPAPLAALGFDLAIFATCLLGAWGLRGPMGALAPAAGWVAVTFLLAMGSSAGSVLITATTAGEWFLFGGAAAVAAGVVTSFALSPRRGRPGASDRSATG